MENVKKCWPTEHPDIAGCGETPKVDALRSHPFNGQLPFARLHKHKSSVVDWMSNLTLMCIRGTYLRYQTWKRYEILLLENVETLTKVCPMGGGGAKKY